MPWGTFRNGAMFCVHKLNDDGSKGKQVACHPTEDAADAQVKALYANASPEENAKGRAMRKAKAAPPY